MIPKECKRLIEVDFPIAEVSKQSAREKSIRHGHPSTLHLWWARRPLAACRSVLLGLLLPDPCDEHCPEEFITKAAELLAKRYTGVYKDESSKLNVQSPQPETFNLQPLTLRSLLLKFIAEFSNWDHSASPLHLEIARGLVKAAHPEETPLVVDPFAGGGSIPLEALRLGCDAFASDLNPVACLIEKVLLEDIPRHGKKLADELRRVGAEIKAEAEKELAEFYPTDPDGSKPIAYLWARTVICESPNCGAEIPLIRSFWLSKKGKRKKALRYSVLKRRNSIPKVEFEVFEPKKDIDVPKGTVDRGNAKCLCCNTILPVERVSQQLFPRHGGADDACLLAVVTLVEQETGRQYRLPTTQDFDAIDKAKKRIGQLSTEKLENGLSVIPDETLPPQGTLGLRVQRYGMINWSDLFTARQKLALITLSNSISKLDEDLPERKLLALVVGKLADLSNTICPWEPIAECPRNVLSNGRLKPAWDFAEGVSTSSSSASFEVCLRNLIAGAESVRGIMASATTQIAKAQASPLADQSVTTWFTDPPYYDAIPYSSLSDFFLVWMKRSLTGFSLLRDPFDMTNPLTPKSDEIIQDEAQKFNGIPKDKVFFENQMTIAFSEGRRILVDNGIGCVVFAHKTTEGWEALLTGMMVGGWVVTGSWPIATEQAHRLRARDSAALGTSVHLICRPRSQSAGVGDWSNILRELPDRIGDWMERLDKEGIHGADLVFSCIGPALELFSRYERVETAEGRTVELAEYLEKVWEVVGRTALEQILGTAEARARKGSTSLTINGASGVLEEDARLTALFLWTLMSTATTDYTDNTDTGDAEDEEDDDNRQSTFGNRKSGYSLQFDVARRFAQPLGIDLEQWKGRIIEIEKGVVRLLPVKERALQLFGEKGSSEIAAKLERSPDKSQMILFPGDEPFEITSPKLKVKGSKLKRKHSTLNDEPSTREATTLDRVHAAMLLQASGKSAALKALIEAEQKRSPDFVRLANALSALYPKNSEEKRLLDAMLLAVPRR
ncbi:MAG: DUF1156 domain-containing protein [bacterium]